MIWHISRQEIENDSSWISSIGVDLTKLHWRKGNYHATCAQNDSMCEVHYDKDDPHDFPVGTAKHLWDWNKLGAIGIGIVSLYALDQVFNDGKVTRKVKKEFGF